MRQISCAVLIVACAGCGNGASTSTLDAPASSSTQALHDHGDNPNPVLFERDSRPYGATMATWGDRLSQWMYAQPAEHNPLFDQTGADCGVGQRGPVWFIPPIRGPRVFSGSRTCTIPPQRALLLDIGNYVNDYPCPDPSFHPAPGQSLYDFLVADAKAVMDGVNFLAVALDGEPLQDVLSYRFVSGDLFTITGDPSLTQTLDSCITGSPQPAISDGFFMMFKPLEPGAHTIVVRGTNVQGADKTFTYHLTVE